MFTCSDSTARSHAGKLAARAIARLFKLYADCDPTMRETCDAAKDVRRVLDEFVDKQMVILHDKDCLKNWAKLEAFLEMLQEIGSSCVTAA